MDLQRCATLARAIYPNGGYPKPLDALVALDDVAHGHRDLDSLRLYLRRRVEALGASADPVATGFGVDLSAAAPRVQQRARKGETMLGQLLLGTLAEQAFEAIYRRILGSSEFRIDDCRENRNDTDYRVLNGGGRPLFRINSKFHGSLFRQARDWVGLAPEDCFPLATYKIWGAKQKEEKENLPYLFLVISTPITSESVAQEVPTEFRQLTHLVHASDLVTGKRAIEEKIVANLLLHPAPFAVSVQSWRDQLARSTWRVLSAQKADTKSRSID
ncbi:MAG: hypothetical protein J0L57_18020 [Burkholderiales bacterium]|nr:hypothetical protein [Burkholderiales bacterium]